MRIILEGLTGTGKTQTIAAMRRLALLPSVVVPEEETFGDLMEEIGAGGIDPVRLVRRLAGVRERLVAEGNISFLLERFHLSYYALLPTWSYYDEIDAQLAEQGASIVLLHVADADLRERCLLRQEYRGADWQGFSQRFGSEGSALSALRQSQERRAEALTYSRMAHVTIDTGAKDWDSYARAIADRVAATSSA